MLKRNIMKKVFLLAGLFILSTQFSCKKDKDNKVCNEEFTGIISDFTGLDGCGMIIALDNGTNLEPYSFPNGFIPINNKRVKICYKTLPDRASICMVGAVVEIISISYL